MPISPGERERLLQLARSAVEAAVRGEPLPEVESPAGVLAEKRGCFVTLKNAGRLRGCIGTFMPDRPLGEMIVQMARAAATQDPRFLMDPVTPAELPQLTVEASVLSPLEETDAPEQLTPGTHGIYVVRGGQSGCFLPEVATEMGWSAGEFLDYCCASKAGLPPGAWRQPGTKVYLFTSEKFE
jgi:hypothetical protein